MLKSAFFDVVTWQKLLHFVCREAAGGPTFRQSPARSVVWLVRCLLPCFMFWLVCYPLFTSAGEIKIFLITLHFCFAVFLFPFFPLFLRSIKVKHIRLVLTGIKLKSKSLSREVCDDYREPYSITKAEKPTHFPTPCLFQYSLSAAKPIHDNYSPNSIFHKSL